LKDIQTRLGLIKMLTRTPAPNYRPASISTIVLLLRGWGGKQNPATEDEPAGMVFFLPSLFFLFFAFHVERVIVIVKIIRSGFRKGGYLFVFSWYLVNPLASKFSSNRCFERTHRRAKSNPSARAVRFCGPARVAPSGVCRTAAPEPSRDKNNCSQRTAKARASNRAATPAYRHGQKGTILPGTIHPYRKGNAGKTPGAEPQLGPCADAPRRRRLPVGNFEV